MHDPAYRTRLKEVSRFKIDHSDMEGGESTATPRKKVIALFFQPFLVSNQSLASMSNKTKTKHKLDNFIAFDRLSKNIYKTSSMMNRLPILTFVIFLTLFISTTWSVEYNFSDPPTATIAVTWINMALKCVHNSKPTPAPTIVSRSLAMVSTVMYDTWAYYDDVCTSKKLNELNGLFARGEYFIRSKNHTLDKVGLKESISFAAYRVLADLWPGQVEEVLDVRMKQLGYNPKYIDTTKSVHAGIGNLAATKILQSRWRDGSNQKGDHPGAPNNYTDYTNYAPRNDPQPATMRCPDNWQPLLIPNVNATIEPAPQKFTTPQWPTVKAFSFTSPSEIRSSTPPPLAKDETTREQLLEEAKELVGYTMDMTDEIKMIAEYWADGPSSVTPPGHWHFFAMDISDRDHHTLEQDVKMYFMLGNAVMDAGIVCWDSKRFYDNARPATMIPYLLGNDTVTGWNGACLEKVSFSLANWIPYQDPYFVTPPFPDFTSGHSTFSAASAEILKRFTGSDDYINGFNAAKGSSAFEKDCPYDVPSRDITVQWKTFSEAADQAGLSRRYGGIHYKTADLAGRKNGRDIGGLVYDKAQLLFQGLDPDISRMITSQNSAPSIGNIIPFKLIVILLFSGRNLIGLNWIGLDTK
ncbi:hypothetical protein DFA_11597 [Cavenderia fasciculata]|uniref:Phosphoesterase n=1 Tax=Cavenderia fasciculata TaxID=261658 RepID=F4QDN9_CACFS|nr:uncharacterized protein DFA_11597 [Cavenderia fasciculata]EGG13836.1 hypothetical protein DFA_11597 [Cavenderia fasciculata]|eukprot:XP_004350544.1 hypothetical protein DFA_11597 [Cavenderia fasciculata]